MAPSNTPSLIANQSVLKKTLRPFTMWGLGVGYVISGMYFGWNLGLIHGGPIGMLFATLIISVMYLAFVYCYAELASLMPRAGGAFYYAHAMGQRRLAVLAGFAQWCEFVFAPPAIAYAIGSYFSLFFTDLSPLIIAIVAYVLFTAINIVGVSLSANLELFFTVLAVGELLVFAGVSAPEFSLARFFHDTRSFAYAHIFYALPFAIWFFLGVEGLANIAEEAANPEKDLAFSFKSVMATLVPLALIVLFCSVGVDGWERVVYDDNSTTPSDSPLPLAMGLIVGKHNLMYHLLVGIGLFGLLASFHGLVLASGRATMELGRHGFLPPFIGEINKKQQTPAKALLANCAVGLIALFSGRTSEIIILSVMGALVLYVVSMVVFIIARKQLGHLPRPFHAPYAPLTPIVALAIASIALASVTIKNPLITLIFATLFLAFYLVRRLVAQHALLK